MPDEKFVKKEELLCADDKEQEIREDREFCPLCSKYRDRNDFLIVNVGPVAIGVCKKCNVVLHNLNLIITRAREKIIKDQIEARQKAEKLITSPEKKIITFPS